VLVDKHGASAQMELELRDWLRLWLLPNTAAYVVVKCATRLTSMHPASNTGRAADTRFSICCMRM
jgi:hypothetical protein